MVKLYILETNKILIQIFENMGRVVDLATTATSIAALNDEGEVFVWVMQL